MKAVDQMGFKTPSAIQSQTIPALLMGHDIIGQAQTGTGKTAAFGIPMVQNTDLSQHSVQSVVLCPTRELAIQVSAELSKLASLKKGLKILPVYGGEAIQHQLKALKKGVHIVVGTPGRVMDHMKRKTLSFRDVKMIVLDEADEMLNMGFREDIEMILGTMPEKRQTVLFSATMPKPIMDIAKKFQNNPKLVKVTTEELTGANIKQFFYDTNVAEKLRLIVRTIQAHQLQLAIVFCNTKIKADRLAEALANQGIAAEAIHGDLNQNQRNTVLGKFKKGTTNVLVATDVAARGIDVNNVDAVFNFDIPLDPEYYVHRIGRTGRAGKDGQSFSFVCGSGDFKRLKQIEKYAKVKIERLQPPSMKDVFDIRKGHLIEQLKKSVEEGLPEKAYQMMDQFTEAGLSNRQLGAALLDIVLPQPSKEDEIPVQSEPKFRDRKRRDSGHFSKGKSGRKYSRKKGKSKGKGSFHKRRKG